MRDKCSMLFIILAAGLGCVSCWNATRPTDHSDADAVDAADAADFADLSDVEREEEGAHDAACDEPDVRRDYEEWSECEVIGTECTPDDLTIFPTMTMDENGDWCWYAWCPGICNCGFIEWDPNPCDPPIITCDLCSPILECPFGVRVVCKGFNETGDQFVIKEGCCNNLGRACCHIDHAPCTNQCME